MRLGGTDDPEVSAAMSEFLLMTELPQFDSDKIDALPLGRAALYIAQAEERVKARERERRRMEAEARAARSRGRGRGRR